MQAAWRGHAACNGARLDRNMQLGRGRRDGRRTRVRKSRHRPNPRLVVPTFADAADALPCSPGRFAMRPNGGAEIPSRMAIRSQARPCRNLGGKTLAGRTANAPAVRIAARRVALPKFQPAALQPRATSGQASQSGCRRRDLRRLHRERAACTNRARLVCTLRGLLATAARTSRRPSDQPTQGGWQRPWLAAGMRRGTRRRIREDPAARRRAITRPERHGQAPVDDRDAKPPPLPADCNGALRNREQDPPFRRFVGIGTSNPAEPCPMPSLPWIAFG